MTVSQPSEETINILAQDIQTFEQAHATLTAHPHLSPALQDLYFQDTPQNPSLDHLVKLYLQDVQIITASRNHSSEQSLNALQRMEEVGPHLLLNKLDMAVTGFENAAKNNTARLHLLQNISLLSAGLMLILESIFIFWPIQKAVHRAFTRLETHKERLEKAQREVLLQNAQLAKVKEKIEHDALHDPLTQLANRRYLDLVLKEKIAQLPVRNEAISLMHVDLDRFKQINDTLGHAAGDHILC
ncbi:MAG: GGDEF domain-containing protein, partial [Pseudomonadota bacterium]